jgi:hypothetical protein
VKQRTITNQDQLRKASHDLLNISQFPFVITVTEGSRTRSSGQNAKYWAELTFFMEQINESISHAAESSGYTDIELRRILADQLPIEQALILYARKKEVIHEVLKDIVNIPTSTRLGTKDFMKFEGRLEQVMSEILGNIRGFLR